MSYNLVLDRDTSGAVDEGGEGGVGGYKPKKISMCKSPLICQCSF